MLEPRCKVANGSGELRIDGVPSAAGRRGVVRLVENQQAPRPERAERIAKRRGIVFVAQQPMRHDETRMRGPRIDRVPALHTHAPHVLAVKDDERQPEALVQFLFPLQDHGRWRGNDDAPDPLAHKKLADNEAGFDRLAEAHVVGDEQVDPWQQQGLAQRLELVGVNPNARAIRRLKQFRIGRGDRVPAERPIVRGEPLRRVELPFGETGPIGLVDSL